ncbi:ABC transporter ATP-binding protein [Vallicoccus soli]|uniref:ABC transporter ATP-binding protein n=1 Tax=Vallicoccus soli TaxID=2339232 RepID=A0A3A3ZKV6_9ACTN|nr:ABC transporter ATP-binding protein [Vallicoccus soli]
MSTALSAAALRGTLTAVLGPNGSGKSTLLRTLAGLQPALGGRALLDGEDLLALPGPERARRVGVVLTERVEPGLLTARDVAALGRTPHLPWGARLRPQDDEAVGWALDAVGAAGLAGRRFAELSDGERQRVLTARALAQEPGLLLLDEPTAFLDVPARVSLLALLRRLAAERDLVVVLSTHDLELALRLADRVWLVGADGALREGSPEALALDGTLGAAFDRDGLHLDPQRGAFVLDPGPDAPVARCADPVAARALARRGWRVVPDGDAELAVTPAADGLVVTHRGVRRVVASVDDLPSPR